MNIILAVADDRAICESLRAALPKTDLVLIENSVEDALRRLISVQADAILIDDAPHLGRKALADLLGAAPATPMIVLSSRGDGETLASFTLLGARACVVKPFSCDALAGAIERCLVQRPAMAPGQPAPAQAPSVAAAIGQHQMALRWMTRTTGLIEDTTRLTQAIVDAAVDIFDAVRSAVLLQTNGNVRCVSSHGIPQNVVAPLRFTFSSGLMRHLEETACLFDRLAAREAPGAAKDMHVLGARLAAPILGGGRVCGAILLGDKASGLDYSPEERDLLTIIARYASSCMEKAKHYRDVSRQQGRLDAILANISAGVVTVRPDKTISMMNESAERILQIRAQDVLGRSVQKLGSAFADAVLRSLAEGTPALRREIHDLAINARLGLSVTPIGAEGAVVIFSIIPAADGGESGTGENLLASPVWEFLASRVAQEIKNPLVAINTFAQLLPRKYDSKEFREEFSDIVQKEVARINDVVEALFEFARHPRASVRPTNLNETVKGILDGFEAELKERSIKLETAYDKDATDVNLDPELFSRALKIVVRNSIDAMESGGTLSVFTRRDNGNCELVVKDTGPGVKPKDTARVFMPFFSTKERGMGLGLTMAIRIMHEHEGELKLIPQSDEGGGFSFHLPSAN